MWKAIIALIVIVFAVHFYLLARTGHFDPCDAAYTKLEYEALGTFKNQKRWLVPEDEERAKLYEAVKRRDILQCYKIALF
jgi:hypothetical protein